MLVRELLDRALGAVDGNQAELARRLGRSETTVSRWVTGRNGIDFESALRLARLTGLPARLVLEACRLDPDLMPPVPGEVAASVAAELHARIERYAETLSQYPRPVWLPLVEANERIAQALGYFHPPPISAPAEGVVSVRDRRTKRGNRASSDSLAHLQLAA